MRSFSIIEAPSSLGLAADGVELLAERLLELGLAERIEARRRERLVVPEACGERDDATGILNLPEILAFTQGIADAMGRALAAGEFPILLGGDCTILLGSMLALRRRGRYGLLFIDGHADFFQPEAEPAGEGASMDLAWATGHGPAQVTRHEGFFPLVQAADVVALGFRDHEDQREFHSQPLPPDLLVLDLPVIRSIGIEAAVQRALEHLSRTELAGFFIHLDVDVLDDTVMPAVDFRMPDGLSWDELRTALELALSSDKAAGLEITIYNPRLDQDGTAGRRLADTLVLVLSGR